MNKNDVGLDLIFSSLDGQLLPLKCNTQSEDNFGIFLFKKNIFKDFFSRIQLKKTSSLVYDGFLLMK